MPKVVVTQDSSVGEEKTRRVGHPASQVFAMTPIFQFFDGLGVAPVGLAKVAMDNRLTRLGEICYVV